MKFICMLLYLAINSSSSLKFDEPMVKVDHLNRLKKLEYVHDFNSLLKPAEDFCYRNSDELFLLVYVHSAPINYKKRLTIRQTWANGQQFKDLKLVFMIGDSKSQQINDLLKLEHSIYGDIVQEDFVDTYRNLTHKAVMALKWISKCCNRAKYVLKVDDDLIVNTFYLERHLRSLQAKNLNNQRSIMCFVYKRMRVIRNKRSKWYLSKEEFKDDRFQTYCSGSAFVLTGDLIRPMYEASSEVKFFWIDDYYVTGLLAQRVNAKFTAFNSLYVITAKHVKKAFVYSKPDWVVFGHFSHLSDTNNQMLYIWNRITQKIKKYNSTMFSSNQIPENFHR